MLPSPERVTALVPAEWVSFSEAEAQVPWELYKLLVGKVVTVPNVPGRKETGRKKCLFCF